MTKKEAKLFRRGLPGGDGVKERGTRGRRTSAEPKENQDLGGDRRE